MKKVIELSAYFSLTIAVTALYIGWVGRIQGFPAYLGVYVALHIYQIIAALVVSGVYFVFKRKSFFRVFMNILWILTFLGWFLLFR